MSEREELKPCPFCGGQVKFVDLNAGPGMRPSTTHMAIVCEPCGYYVEFGQRSMMKMSQKWNERKAPDEK